MAATGVRLVTIDAEAQFLEALAGVSDPETKRKIIGREFIRTFEQAAADVVAEALDGGGEVKFLVKGPSTPDIVESGGGSGTAVIKPPQCWRSSPMTLSLSWWNRSDPFQG